MLKVTAEQTNASMPATETTATISTTDASTEQLPPRLTLPLELVRRILNVPPPFQDETDARACELLVEELSDDELNVAAQTSYVFWVASIMYPDLVTAEIRHRAAMKEARRHYIGEGKDYAKALLSLQTTIDFRRERKVDLLKTCMQPDHDYYLNEDSQTATRYRDYIKDEAKCQTNVVRGHDKMFRCLLVKLKRHSLQANNEAFLMAHVYLVERAIATTEVLTEGKEEKCVGICDFGAYHSAFAPPRQVMKSAMDIFQRHYPERLSNLFILDPPLWMRVLYAVLRVFLSTDTCEKIIMIHGEEEKERLLGSHIDRDQAMPFMLPGGKLDSPAEMDIFLYDTPFHCLYDDKGLVEADKMLDM